MFPQYLNRIVIMDGYIVNIIMVIVYCLRRENTPSRFTFMTFLLPAYTRQQTRLDVKQFCNMI